MNPDPLSPQLWSDLSAHAAERLPADFSRRVIDRSRSVRRARRQIGATLCTLTLCTLGATLALDWGARQQQQQNLALWQELTTVALAVDRGF